MTDITPDFTSSLALPIPERITSPAQPTHEPDATPVEISQGETVSSVHIQKPRRARLAGRLQPLVIESAPHRWGYLVLTVLFVLAFFFFVRGFWQPADGGYDENGYLVGGKMFADHFSTRYSPINPDTHQIDPYSFVGMMWIGADLNTPKERYYPKYPIGLPVLVAGCLKLFGPVNGVVAAHLISPISSTLALLFLFLLLRSFTGSFTAFLGTIALAASPVTLELTTIPSSHAPDLLFVVAGMYFLVQWWQKGGRLRAGLAGLLIGYAATIRYTEAMLLLPLLLAAGFNFRRWRRESWLQTGLLLVGWAIPVGYLACHNLMAFGHLTGYDPTNESTGFSWEFFQYNWETMLRQMYDTGLFILLPMGVLGLILLYRQRWQLGLMLTAWLVPSLIVYSAYYWAPDRDNQIGYLRFFLTILPPLVLGAMYLLRLVATRKFETTGAAKSDDALTASAEDFADRDMPQWLLRVLGGILIAATLVGAGAALHWSKLPWCALWIGPLAALVAAGLVAMFFGGIWALVALVILLILAGIKEHLQDIPVQPLATSLAVALAIAFACTSGLRRRASGRRWTPLSTASAITAIAFVLVAIGAACWTVRALDGSPVYMGMAALAGCMAIAFSFRAAPAAQGCLIALAAAVPAYKALPTLDHRFMQNVTLGKVGQLLHDQAPPHSVVFSYDRMLNHIGFIGDYQLYDIRQFNFGFMRAMAQRSQSDDPQGIQAQRAKTMYERLEHFSGPDLVRLQRQIIFDALSHGHPVYFIGQQWQLATERSRLLNDLLGRQDNHYFHTRYVGACEEVPDRIEPVPQKLRGAQDALRRGPVGPGINGVISNPVNWLIMEVKLAPPPMPPAPSASPAKPAVAPAAKPAVTPPKPAVVTPAPAKQPTVTTPPPPVKHALPAPALSKPPAPVIPPATSPATHTAVAPVVNHVPATKPSTLPAAAAPKTSVAHAVPHPATNPATHPAEPSKPSTDTNDKKPGH